MPRPRKLTPEQHKELAERHLLYMRLRLEAAKHSPYQLSKEFGIDVKRVHDYLRRKVA